MLKLVDRRENNEIEIENKKIRNNSKFLNRG